MDELTRLAHAVRPAIASSVAIVVLAAIGLGGCGGSGSPTTAKARNFDGLTAKPVKAAPPLALKDSLGHRVNIENYRGKAVLVTFIYDHCPDICPLIVTHLRTAQNELGQSASELQIIAVSVDPKGDTPRTVRKFLAEHEMTGRMQYLIGSRPQLEKVWSAWKIVSRSSPKKNNPDLVEHSALIYGISGSGKITTLYPASFKPAQIVHDVPILASS